MTSQDVGTFDRAFRRVVVAFRLRLKPDELDELARTYFRVLEAAPLDDVLAAGKSCLQAYRTFPKPAEWLQALPLAPLRLAADLRVMTTPERLEYARAEALHYDDAPCPCEACRDAGVTDRPLRFVPDDDGGVLARAIDLERNRIVVTGHWAHGDALARWYRARETFYACAPRRSPLGRALVALVCREPGEEG